MNKFFAGLIIGLILGALYDTNKIEEMKEPIPVKLEQPEFFLSDKPTNKLVLEACKYYDIKHPGIVVSQAILETGHYRSDKCVNDNNLFGLYNSNKKEYYKFEHWTESVKKYKEWIQYKYKNGDYYEFLLNLGYATDSLYIPKIKDIKKRYKL